MNLSDCPTPLTDALRSKIPDPRAIQDMTASHGDLERKLRKCRAVIGTMVLNFDRQKCGEREYNTAEELQSFCMKTLEETK